MASERTSSSRMMKSRRVRQSAIRPGLPLRISVSRRLTRSTTLKKLKPSVKAALQ